MEGLSSISIGPKLPVAAANGPIDEAGEDEIDKVVNKCNTHTNTFTYTLTHVYKQTQHTHTDVRIHTQRTVLVCYFVAGHKKEKITRRQ